jgi:hypothetical protein
MNWILYLRSLQQGRNVCSKKRKQNLRSSVAKQTIPLLWLGAAKIIGGYKHVASERDPFSKYFGPYFVVGFRSCMHSSCPREGNREAPI